MAISVQDLITTVTVLRRRGTGFRALHEELDTTTPGGRLVFHVFAALAEFVRELIVEGTCDGLEAARARGVRLGRPPAMTAEQVRQARDLLARPDTTVSSIARLLNVSRSTIYKYVPELSGGSESALGRGGVEAPALAGRGGKAAPARHESRPGRVALVATSLPDWRRPSEGTVELPLHLFWSSPDHEFDLGESYMELSLYETVLREASRLEDLARYLNAETLVRILPELFLAKASLQTAGFATEREDKTSGLADLFPGMGDGLAEWIVTSPTGQQVRLQMSYFNRGREPVVMDIGPVLALDDLLAGKTIALASRAAERDYIDTAAALNRGYTVVQLISLARELDPGLDDRDFAEAGDRLDRLNDKAFARYDLDRQDIAQLRAYFSDWPRSRH